MSVAPNAADEARLSRRRILGRLSVAAVGGGALAATGVVGGGRAAAQDGDNLVLGANNFSETYTYLGGGGGGGLQVNSERNAWSLYATSNYIGVWGLSRNVPFDNTVGPHIGVLGEAANTCSHDKIGVRGVAVNGGGTGVEGISQPYGYGVHGFSGQGFGVRGEVTHVDGIGVAGVGPRLGVRGEGETGVLGLGTTGHGVKGTVPNTGYGVLGRAGGGFGVKGEATLANGVGVGGTCIDGGVAVRGTTPDVGYGVLGEAGDGFGVRGTATSGIGVGGQSTGGTGVRGESQTATGVYGRSANHTGVTGYGGIFGVVGQCDAGGTAVTGTSSNGGVGVRGASQPTGYGVRGESESGFGVRGDAVTGIGVSGVSTKSVGVSGAGRTGGEFKGSRAAVRLVPTTTSGPPTTSAHRRGELICDNNGQFWGCASDGTPGTWVRLG